MRALRPIQARSQGRQLCTRKFASNLPLLVGPFRQIACDYRAVETGNAGTVDALLRAGANVDQQKKLDETALFVAVREIANPDQPQLQGQLRGIVGLLLAHGADIDLRGNIEEGKTKVPLSAFELACMNGDIEIAELLIRADAPDSVNKLKRLQGGKGERAKSLERPNGSAYVRLLAEAQRRDR